VPYNLVTYSQKFDNANWINVNYTLTANNIANPINGQVDAFRISLNSGTAIKAVIQTNNQNGSYTQSVYIKAGTHNFIQLLVGNDPNPYANFNVALGTFNAYNCTASITSAGNGWYRCSINYSTSIGVSGCNIWAVDSLTSARAAATSSTGNFYAYGFQLNEGTLKDYQRTETRLNIPRLDYSNGSCPSLLVEPQRTNTVTYSEQLDNSNWVKGDATISANSAIAPNGTNTADKFIANSNNAAHLFYQSVPTGSCTFSIYAKAAEETVFSMWLNDFSKNARFDLSTGTVVFSNVTSANITNVGNGWFRCEVYDTTSTSFVAIFGRNAAAYIGNGVNGMFFWGAQAEAASYPTSYIPTTSASVTRNADVISKTGISSLIGQTEGTLFAHWTCSNANTSGRILAISDGGFTNRIIILESSGTIRVFVSTLSVVQFDADNLGSYTGTHKIAIAYANNDLKIYLDGVAVATATTLTVPACSAAYLGTLEDGTNATALNGGIFTSALYTTRLTNAQLAQLTTI
jgi:hypothetical protein